MLGVLGARVAREGLHVRVGPVVRPPVPRPAVRMRVRLAARPRPHALHDVQRDRVLEVVGVVELA